MLDRTSHVENAIEQRRSVGDRSLPVVFVGVVTAAMVAWIAAIAWASWGLITWLLQ